MKILTIEDEVKISDFIVRGLTEEGYEVDAVFNGHDGINAVKNNSYDLILLDLNLPDIDGITVCTSIRNLNIFTPIIMLTIRDKISDKVHGLDSGANDYLTKPFAFEELIARIRVLMRETTGQSKTKLVVDSLVMDLIQRKVTREGKEIDLTVKEFELLEYLMRHTGHIVTRIMIIEKVWEYSFDPISNALDVYINHIRNKIDKSFSKKLLFTFRGRGYMIKG